MKSRPGWKTLPRLPFDIGRRSALSGRRPGPLFRLKFFVREADRALVGYVRFAAACEGPPGHVHGGMSALVLDEAMGACVWLKDYCAVAGKLEFEYRAMVPIGTVIEVEAVAQAARGRRVHVRCSLRMDGRILVRGRGTFVRLPDGAVERLLHGGKTA